MSAAAPTGFANLPAPLGPGNADPGGVQIFAYNGQLWGMDSGGNLWNYNSPRGDWLPSDAGLLEFNFDPAAAVAGTVLVAGKATMARINIRTPTVVNNVLFHVTTVASGLTASQNYVGIYSSAGTLLGSSAATSLDSKVTSTGVITQALASPTALAPGFYWVAQLYGAGTPPVCAQAANTVANANTGTTATNFRWCTNGTSLTSLAGSITPASNVVTSAQPFWVGVS